MPRRSFALFAFATASLLAGCQSVFFRTLNAGGRSSVAQREIYDADRGLSLDVYRPAQASSPAPALVFFYGGSWRTGDRKDYAFVGRALAARGVLTFVADYRKFPDGAFPRFEEDAATAAAWCLRHASEFGGDPQRVFIGGHSAGAHLAALLATDAHYLDAHGLAPRDFAGAIGIAGPYDFLPLTDPKLVEVFGEQSQWPRSQPINFVDGDEPPFLLLQGTGDRIVDPRNADSLAGRLRAAGVATSLKSYPGVGHFRILVALRYPALAPTLADVTAFIAAAPVPSPTR